MKEVDTQLIIYGSITNIKFYPKIVITLNTDEYGKVDISISKKIFNKANCFVINNIFGQFGINVEAKQNLETKQLTEIKAVSITNYTNKYDSKKMKHLIKEGTEAWKDVKDVNEWLRDIRGID